jgi:DNA adenine methylase
MSKLFYENNLLGVSYAEPYAGGAGLALRLLFEEYVNKIYINDFDRSIYAIWHSIINDSEEFCNWIADVDISVDNWHIYKDIQKKSDEYDLFELAKSTFFLNRTNVSGVIKGGIIGGVEQRGKYKIDVRFNKDDLINKICKIASFRNRIFVSNLDGIAFIKKMDKKREDIFIYLDPPYYKKASDLYMNFYLEKDHENLSRHVRNINKRWMISYDNQDFILNLYAQERKVLYNLSQCASNRVGNEILIFSEGINFADSMNYLKTPVLI